MSVLSSSRCTLRATTVPGGAEIDCGDGIRAALAYYRPHEVQARHRHDFAQLSFLLSGSMRECQRSREYVMHGSGVGFKPALLDHSDSWGKEGALIFSLKLRADSVEIERHAPGWRVTRDLHWLPLLVRLCFATQETVAQREILQDAISFSRRLRTRAGSSPPNWLEATRAQIHDAPDLIAVDDAARDAGVHRAHFCRMFVRFYGMPPSVYRRRVASARAITAMTTTTARLAEIAQASGFSDQAHLTRTLRGDTGLTPSSLRTLLGAGRPIRRR